MKTGSIQFRLLVSIMLSILAMAIVAFTAIFSMNRSVNRLVGVAEGVKQLEKRADTAHLEFKTQVQEWKNILLRGQDPDRMDRYWTAFNKQSDQVSTLVAGLANDLEAYPELQAIASWATSCPAWPSLPMPRPRPAPARPSVWRSRLR